MFGSWPLEAWSDFDQEKGTFNQERVFLDQEDKATR